MLAVARRYHAPWLLVLAVVALVAAVWLARPEMPIAASEAAARGDTVTMAPHAHAGLATITTRVPAPFARSEQTRREVIRLDPSFTGPDDTSRPARTPLYALLRVFRL